MTILDEYPFALCLTHDLDRVYKSYKAVYYALTEREPRHLLDLAPGRNPYWQFEAIMDLEADLGVRSALYVQNEQNLFRDKPPRTWVLPEYWKLYTGRYSLTDPAIATALSALADGGWEIGLHGSFESYRDPDRLRRERRALETVVDEPILGGRQHYLNLERPHTWEHHADVGLRYDATLGSSEEYGFQHGYEPLRPFDDEFVVFPLTLMESALPAVETDPDVAWCRCLSLLEEARANGAVMTVLWHPDYFSERDHPNYRPLYRRLVERAQAMGAWVGPPGQLYRSLDHPGESPAVATTASAEPVARTGTDGPVADGQVTDGQVVAESVSDGPAAEDERGESRIDGGPPATRAIDAVTAAEDD